VHFFVERDLCPTEDLVSGSCHNNDIQTWLQIVRYLFVFLSAVVVVVVATSIAPNHKKEVARIGFLIGAVAATYMAIVSSALTLFLAAFAGGGIGVWFSLRWLRGNSPNNRLQRAH